MTALTEARDTDRLGKPEASYGADSKLVIQDAAIIWKGALLMLEAGEVVPGKPGLSSALKMLGRAPKSLDNTADGLLTEVDRGTFLWNMTSPVAGDAQKTAYVMDDQTVGLAQHGAGTAQVNTITPAAANTTPYGLQIRWDEHGEGEWKSTTLFSLSDASGTATEIADELRAQLALIDELSGVITGTGTATLILTGAQGVRFELADVNVGVLADVATTPGVYIDYPRAGTIVGFASAGVYVQPDV